MAYSGRGRYGRPFRARGWTSNQSSDDYNDYYGNSSGGSRRGGGRHPPHLKGRDIGLWYASKQGGKSKDQEKRERAVVKMDLSREQQITQLLQSHGRTINTEDSFPPDPSWEGKIIKPEESKEEPIDDCSKVISKPMKQDEALDRELHEELVKKMQGVDQHYLNMQEFRMKLPSFKMRETLLPLINNNRAVVISGETGCGKTTQVPQFILDDQIARGRGSMCRIVCTQPRRISAISVAERVASERGESCGNRKSTGYQIRLQSRMPRDRGSILYCTTGIVLQWLQSDVYLSGVSHLVLDEVHERSLQSDFLLTIVRDLLPRRPDLSIVIMSATLNAEMFSSYFGDCPISHIPGFTFPVKEFLLEDVIQMISYHPQQQGDPKRRRNGFMRGRQRRKDEEEKEREYNEKKPQYLQYLVGKYSEDTIRTIEALDEDDAIDTQLIGELIKYIVLNEKEGAILVFLPGWEDIRKLHTLLTSQLMFTSDRFRIIPLHSLMPTVTQTKVFDRPPPGVWKIIIATNIAETSITIEDVVHVIDCGKIKETNYDVDNDISTMKPEWVSLANARQRRGRAGRVQEGFCYHLYNNLRARLLNDYQLPELLRTPLEELCLQIKILKFGQIASFLDKAMQPPSLKAVKLAVTHLKELNALDSNEELTALGFHLARLPVEPTIGKLILFGAMFGCLDPILTIAASLSFKDPFVIPLGKEKYADLKRKGLSRESKSDHLTIVYALQGWEDAKRIGFRAEQDFCWDFFLSANTLQMLHNMKAQFVEHLHSAGFVDSTNPKDHKANINSGNIKLLKAVICAGLYPKVAKIRPNFNKRKGAKIYTKHDGKVSIHPKSVNVDQSDFNHHWLIYHLKMKTSNIFLYDCTEVSPYSLLFFGGKISMQKEGEHDTIAVDDWIVFKSPIRIAHLVKKLRAELDSLLQQKITQPGPVEWQRDSSESKLLKAIIDLITTEEGACGAGGSEQRDFQSFR
uniref:ATP-dependent DNA/RNA helicase DHX36 n=1 Tax=Myxine glutinosa TaxID=7769 RepID=UPI00358F2A3E